MRRGSRRVGRAVGSAGPRCPGVERGGRQRLALGQSFPPPRTGPRPGSQRWRLTALAWAPPVGTSGDWRMAPGGRSLCPHRRPPAAGRGSRVAPPRCREPLAHTSGQRETRVASRGLLTVRGPAAPCQIQPDATRPAPRSCPSSPRAPSSRGLFPLRLDVLVESRLFEAHSL